MKLFLSAIGAIAMLAVGLAELDNGGDKVNAFQGFPVYPGASLIRDGHSPINALAMSAWKSPNSKAEVIAFYSQRLLEIDENVAITQEGDRTKFVFRASFSPSGDAILYVGPSDQSAETCTFLLFINTGPSEFRLKIID